MATVSKSIMATANPTDVEMMGGNMTFLTVDYVNTNASTGPEGVPSGCTQNNWQHKHCGCYWSQCLTQTHSKLLLLKEL